MEDLEECDVDEEFRKQLENCVSQTPLIVIAKIRETPEVIEALNKERKGHRRSTPEGVQATQDAETRMMEPACRYLEGLGVPYNPMNNIHFISAKMTPRQILDFIKKPYVRIVFPDQ